MTSRLRKRLGRLIWFAALLGLLVTVGVTAWLAWRYAENFTRVGCIGERTSLAAQGFPSEAVEIPTPRGYTLRGWLTQGGRHPGVVILVLPGGPGNTDFALADAALLAGAGYGTLVYEHRTCADPGQLHSGGFLEADDVLSAVAYLHGRADVRRVGILGFSAGGTAALLAAAREPRLAAVVAEGGFTSLTAETFATQDANNPLDGLFRRFILLFLSWQLGAPVEAASPVARIGAISPRPVLLVYGDEEAGNGQALYAAAGAPKDLWIVPGVGHGGYQAAHPDEYAARITPFFDKTLGVVP